MISFRTIITINLLLISLVLVQTQIIAAKDKEVKCNEITTQINCRISFIEPTSINSITVRANEKDIVTKVTKFSELTKPTSVALLLDINSKYDPDVFSRQKKLITKLLNSNIQNINFEIFSFSSSFSTISPAGTAIETTKLALASVQQTGKNSQLLKAIYQIADQSKVENTNRFLIVFSDGISDDKAYSPQEVSSKLQSNYITLFAILPGKSKSDLQAAQVLQRFSDDTHGKILFNSDEKEFDQTVGIISSALSNGTEISFEKVSQDFEIQINYKDNSSDKFSYKSPNSNNIVMPQQNASAQLEAQDLKPKEKIDENNLLEKYENLVIDWINQNQTNRIIAICGGLITLLFVLILILKVSSSSKQKTKLSHSTDRNDIQVEPEINRASVGPILAWFEILDSENTQELIRSQSTTIGRHKDNDIVFKNTSVHRHHAVLTQDPSGQFTITDLGGSNGTIVNGIKKDKSNLTSGDIVELGEVRMRFQLANSNM